MNLPIKDHKALIPLIISKTIIFAILPFLGFLFLAYIFALHNLNLGEQGASNTYNFMVLISQSVIAWVTMIFGYYFGSSSQKDK